MPNDKDIYIGYFWWMFKGIIYGRFEGFMIGDDTVYAWRCFVLHMALYDGNLGVFI